MTWERRHGLARRATAAHRRRLAPTAASQPARFVITPPPTDEITTSQTAHYSLVHCCSNLPPGSSRCCAHHGNPRRERRVQLPGGLPWRHPRAVRLAVGEEGRRNGTTVHTPLLQYNAAQFRVCFCSVEDGSSPRRARTCKVYVDVSASALRLSAPTPRIVRASGNGRRGPGRRPRPARAPSTPFVYMPLLRIASPRLPTALLVPPTGCLTPQWQRPSKRVRESSRPPLGFTDEHTHTLPLYIYDKKFFIIFQFPLFGAPYCFSEIVLGARCCLHGWHGAPHSLAHWRRFCLFLSSCGCGLLPRSLQM